MKYFLDTEFTERPGFMQLISIGIVGENGRTFYAENASFDEREANDWVQDNVFAGLKWWTVRNAVHPGRIANSSFIDGTDHWQVFGPMTLIREQLLEFFEKWPPVEFYGYYSDYDWVNFCWIFGKMVDLPVDFPMYCRDLKQMLDEIRLKKLPSPRDKHNALVDALWNRDLFKHIQESVALNK